MAPAIGIGFLSLTGILFLAYILFLNEQQKLQDELARHCREEDARDHPSERVNTLIEVWECQSCGFMSTIQSFCIHCASPRPQSSTFQKIDVKQYTEQPRTRHPGGLHTDTQTPNLVPR